MPKNTDNFHLYSDVALVDLIERFDGTRQQWAASYARSELRSRGVPC